MKLKHTFAALRYPNYRLWFLGQLISLFGSWMQMTAQSFLVFELTRSPAFLGYTSFAFGVPSWLFMLYGGVVADRVKRRTLLMIAQSCMMLFAFIMASLTFAGVVQPWHIILIVFCLGTANAFDAPARQAFVFELVGREDITNAVALNSTLFNLSAVIGPALAGVIYTVLGPAWCFMLNGVSFVAVLTALMLMRLPRQTAPVRKQSALSSLREGIRYVVGDNIIFPLMCIVSLTSLFGLSLVTLMPAWAVTVLGGDATTNGLLQSARGTGAVVGALLIAVLGHAAFRGKMLTAGSLAFPLFLFVFALTRWLPLSLVFMVGAGVALVLVMNLANALLQSLVEDGMRGRVMSIYTLTHFGLMPLGGLLAGALAEITNEPLTVVINSVICLIASLLMCIYVPRIRKLR